MNNGRTRMARLLRAVTGGNGVEFTLALGACASVVWAMVATVNAGFADRFRGDLTFAGTLDEIERLIDNQGPAGIAAYRPATVMLGDHEYPVDSLEITGDQKGFPSLAPGGFLNDQIVAFNDNAARRAIKNAVTGDSPVNDVSASLFHLVRTDSGHQSLSPSMNSYVLTVPSPFSAHRWTTIRARDWSSGPALIGLLETMPLSLAATLSEPMRPAASSCRIKPVGSLTRLVYCGSLAGIDVARGYEFAIDLKRQASFAYGAAIKLDGDKPVWMNGRRRSTGSAAHSGDLLYRPLLGPVLLSDVRTGILAQQQWINGRASFVTSRAGTIQFFGRAGRSTESSGDENVTLTVDAELSRDIDERLDAFMAKYSDYLEAVSVVVADISNGELRAISETAPRDGGALRAFEPLLFGSMIKPILAAAILSEAPDLASMTVDYAGPLLTSAGGMTLTQPLRNPANGCEGTIDLNLFFQCSSNQFAAELMIRSLRLSDETVSGSTRRVIPREVLDHSPLVNGLLNLYDDADVVRNRDARRSSRIWRPYGAKDAEKMAPTDHTLYPWKSRPWFVYPDSTGTPVDLLVRFAIGGWENRWTMLGAAEAYARIATDRRVQLTIRKAGAKSATFPLISARASNAFAWVREGLERVADRGTALGLGNVFQSIDSKDDSLVVLAKTGTLNEITARTQDDDVYLKSLAVVVGRPARMDKNRSAAVPPLRCGLVAIAHFEFRQDWRERTRAGSGASLPDLHRRFAENELAAAFGDSWQRLKVCESGK